MKKEQTLKLYTLEELLDKHIGKLGTPKRDAFENKLKLELLGETVKQVREERHLTQEQLGIMAGVQKKQISMLENNLNNVRFEIIMKVLKALDAKINFNIEILNRQVQIA